MKAYELRIYQVAPGKMDAIQAAIHEVMTPLMRDYSMEPLQFFAAPDGATIYRTVEHETLEGIASNWERLHADPRWIEPLAERTQGSPFVTDQQSIPLVGIAGLPARVEADRAAVSAPVPPAPVTAASPFFC